MESEKQSQSKRKHLAFFNLTNERVIDLLSYSKYLYYIGMIETILFTLSIIGIPLIGFSLLATSFNDSPPIERVNIVNNNRIVYNRIVYTMEILNYHSNNYGSPFGLFFGLLGIVVIEIWAIYVAEMYRLKYKELQEEENETHSS